MTTKDSILALAAKISNDTVPNVATDAQALGELAKAMCGTAPEVPLATVDDAIAFITANYSGGGGGGGGTTTDMWLWNATEGSGNDVLPESVCYVKGLTEADGAYTPVLEPLEFEAVTEQYMGVTIYGVRVKDAPVGADTSSTFSDGYTLINYNVGYSPQAFPPVSAASIYSTSVLAPIEGFVLSGSYSVKSGN